MTQLTLILNHLTSGQTLTPLEALSAFGCFRLGARIWELKQLGEPIKSELIEVNGKHIARYSWDFEQEKIPYG